MTRPVPAACLRLIHEFEGSNGKPELCPKQDPAGNWEIGWSHKIAGPNHPAITAAEADQIALNDLSEAADEVEAALGVNVTEALTDGQFAALIDFTFNEGGGKFASSTLAACVRAGHKVAAGLEFDRWVYAEGVALDGLRRRRAAEKALFLS